MSRVLCLVLLLWGSLTQAQPPSSLLINAKTGGVVAAQHAHVPRYPASLTKLMTLYIAFEKLKKGALKPKDLVRFSRKACAAPASKLHFKPKAHMTVIDAILALSVKSANDVAIALAEHLGGSEEGFACMMNQKAQELGMHKTIFKNASGLPNRAQVSTAYDLARLAKAIIDHFPEYRHVFSTQYFHFRGKKYKNTNGLLGQMNGVDGMKTGYTRAAGWNLITSYHRGKDHLIGVVIGEKSKQRRDLHMRYLLEGRKLSAGEIRRITTRTPDYFQEAKHISRWGVQIGVFKNSKQARTYAQKVKTSHLQLLKTHTYRIVSGISKRAKLFKTRFNFASHKQAQEICAALKQRGVSCFVVSGG